MIVPNGLCAFPITPTDSVGRINVTALSGLIQRLVAANVDSIGVLGSTGIYMYLTREERRLTLETTMDVAGGQVPVVAGIGALRTDDAVKYAQDARAAGAVAGLLSAASYTPLSEDEVFEHFADVALKSRLPIIIYDNPGTTHFHFSAKLIRRLADVPGIVAIKNSAASSERSTSHLKEQRAIMPDAFSIGCSGDWTAANALFSGASVWYSVLGGILPEICLKLVRASQDNDLSEAIRIDRELGPIWELFKSHSSIRVAYALADELGICSAIPPRPILPVSHAVKRAISDLAQKLRA